MSTNGGPHIGNWNLEAEPSRRDENSLGKEPSGLGELQSSILSAQHYVQQVQREFNHLKDENTVLRKQLFATNGDRVLRASAGSNGWTSVKSVDFAIPEFLPPHETERPETPADAEPAIIEDSQSMRRISNYSMDTIDEMPQRIKPALGKQRTQMLTRQHTSQVSLDSSPAGWLNGFQDDDVMIHRTHTAATQRVSFRETRENSMRAMLMDPETVKRQMYQNLSQQKWSVDVLYYKEGLAARIVCSPLFEQLNLLVIVLNTIWIAVDTEHNKADVLIDAPVEFQITEHLFCCYFTAELMVRFAAFERKANCFQSTVFLLDLFLVITMVFEDWIMSIILLTQVSGHTGETGAGVIKNAAILRILRLVRLARLGRAVKLVRQSPEVMIMVKAFASSTRCVCWTCVLLACMIFFFGVIFTQICKDSPLESEYFPSLTGSMHTLLIAGLFPDLNTISRAINKAHLIYWAMFFVYLMMTTITVLNLLIGVLVEVAQTSARVERDAMDVAFVKEVFVNTLGLEEVHDFSAFYVSREEFIQFLQETPIQKALTKVGIDIFGLVDLLDFIFIRGPLGFTKLMETVLALRSGAAVTVRDLVEVRKFLSYEITKLKAELQPSEFSKKPQFQHVGSEASVNGPPLVNFSVRKTSDPVSTPEFNNDAAFIQSFNNRLHLDDV